MNSRFLQHSIDDDKLTIVSVGSWRLENLNNIEKELNSLPKSSSITWDLSGIEDFDSAGVLLFMKYLELFEKNSTVEVVGYTEAQKNMYDLLKKSRTKSSKQPAKYSFLDKVGKRAIDIVGDIRDFATFLGHLTVSLLTLFIRPKNIRLKEITYHAYESGVSALLIVGLTAFLVGMVIAYQGAVQLAKFGADIFIVDTVTISMVRELGPMITAIVIAGRSGSAYTAEIGAMKITEEISAMRTMGFDPYYFLVIPRLLALMIVLPLLVFFADILGIMGGVFAAKIQLGLSITQFVDRMYEILDIKHYILGMIKVPVFAFTIAAIGCYRGFKVSDNTESIGLQTTASVVNSIFMVIALDAVFSVIYTGFSV